MNEFVFFFFVKQLGERLRQGSFSVSIKKIEDFFRKILIFMKILFKKISLSAALGNEAVKKEHKSNMLNFTTLMDELRGEVHINLKELIAMNLKM